MLTAVLLGGFLAGLDLSGGGAAVEKVKENVVRYEVRKVSRLPERDMSEDAEKINDDKDVKRDKMTPEYLRKRYYAYIVSKIEKAKIYPAREQKKGHEGRVVFQLYVRKNGSVRKLRIIKESRYPGLTRASVNSVKKAMPFGPFPLGIPDDELIIKVKMNFYLQ